jgi:hypothetical protein
MSTTNKFTEVRAEELIEQCGLFHERETTFEYQEAPEHTWTPVRVPAPGTAIKDRDGDEIELFSAQRNVLKRLCNPLALKSADVTVENTRRRELIEGQVEYSGNFPVTKILNLPPGYGKTILSVLMTLNILTDTAVRKKFREDFGAYLAAHQSHAGRSVRHVTPWTDSIQLLDNAALIHVPLQLVGAWQSTFAHNVPAFEEILNAKKDPVGAPVGAPVGTGRAKKLAKASSSHASSQKRRKIHVMPADGETLRAAPFDPDTIQKNPDDLYVFIVHTDNMKDYLSHRDTYYTYGIFVTDEAADSKSAPLMPQNNLAGMYTTLVTATPAHLASRIASTPATDHHFIAETFRHPRLSRSEVAACVGNPARDEFATAWIRSRATNGYLGGMICDILAMNIVPPELYDDVTSEVMQIVPAMHEFNVTCADSYARRLGFIAHDMAPVCDAGRLLERNLNLKLSGESVEQVVRSIDTQIRTIVETLNKNFPLNPNELRGRRAALEKFKGLLLGDVDKACGVCFDNLTTEATAGAAGAGSAGSAGEGGAGSEAEPPKERLGAGSEAEPPKERFFTTCCAFLCCRTCLQGLAKDKIKCPKCRTEGALFSRISTDVLPSKKKKLKTSSGAGAGGGGGDAEDDAPAVGVKDVAGFEKKVERTNFLELTQMAAVEKILYDAQEHNLTHVVIAGAHVDTWLQFGPTIRTIAGFKIVRPRPSAFSSAASGAARRMNDAYYSFCTESHRQVLVLDSVVNASCELTGIDAKLTDLIIQIGADMNSKQLSGRALRIGRNPLLNPVKVVLA